MRLTHLQSRDLIQQTVIAGDSLFILHIQLLRYHPAEDIQTVIDGHQNYSLTGEMFAVKVRGMTIAGHESATVYPENDRKLLICALRRRPHIQIQAILTHLLLTRVKLANKERTGYTQLRALCGCTRTVAHAFPVCCRLRRLPA